MRGNEVRMRGADVWYTKSYHEVDYPHPVIEHRLVRWTDQPQSITIVDPVPDSANPDHVAFEPAGSADWRREGGRLVFERAIDVEEFRTAYTYRGGFGSHLEEWLAEPTVEVEGESLSSEPEDGQRSIETDPSDGSRLIDFP